MSWRDRKRKPGELPDKCYLRKCDGCGKEWVVGVETAKWKVYFCPDCERASRRKKRSA